MSSPVDCGVGELFSVNGKAAIVTGAGSGIGRAAAECFCRNGASVVLVDIDEERLAGVCGGLTDARGAAAAFACDVTSEGRVAALKDFALAKFGKIDMLINSHGISGRVSADDMTGADFDRVIGVNLKGVFLTTAIIGRAMAAGGGGGIVNISSIAAHVCLPNNVNYAAAKGGLEAMTRSFAGEWAKKGVRVNAVAPGPCRTEFTKSLYEQPGYYENLVAKIPRGYVPGPEDLMGPILLLATGAGANITGQVIVADGGYTIV